MNPRIVAISGALKGQEFQLDKGRVSIGRDASNTIAAPDSAVSRRHCLVEWLDGHAQLTDLESHNGTFVNGIPVSRRTLAHGDVVRLGLCELVYLTEDVSPSSMSQVYSGRTVSSDFFKTIKLGDSRIWSSNPTDVGRMARDLNALVKISQTINSIRDSTQLQHRLLECIFEVVPAEAGAILLLDQPEDEPASIVAYDRDNTDSPAVTVSREMVQRALWEQSAVVAGGAASEGSAICVPLLGVQRTVGVLYLSSAGKEQKFGDDHIHFLNSAASIAAVTLENLLALESLKAENRRLRAELDPPEGMVGDGKAMRQLAGRIDKVAQGESTVLIRGESGTGKEVVSRAIHAASPRADKPFVAINCAAIPDALLESELFGHEKGSFTGAVAMKKGKLEVAEDGTVLLDEIGELVPTMQAKLLRVLQQREFERVGGTRPIPLHARVLAATNKDLEAAIKSGEFRQDLFYRLNVVSVAVPPLRKHREDIPLLAIYFATQYAQKCNRPFKGITSEARALLMNYDWPGNVRELENAIEHAIVLGASDELRPEDLPEALLERQSDKPAGTKYHAAISDLKKRLIRDALAEANGNYTDAAKILGVHPNYLHRLIRNLEMKAELREQESE
jgi:two-component system, NtrC family, response regulator HydG